MKASKYKSQNHFYVQQYDQVGLLPKQINLKSNLALTYRQKIKNSRNMLKTRKGNTISTKKVLLYLLGFGILGLIIIMDLGGHIGLNIKRRSDFLDNLEHMKVQRKHDKENIIDMSLDNAKRYQISRTEDPQLMLPNFVKHVKQTITQKNNQQNKETNGLGSNSGYLSTTFQTPTQQGYTGPVIKPSTFDTTNLVKQALSIPQTVSSINANIRNRPLPPVNANIPIQRKTFKNSQTAGVNMVQKENAKQWRSLVNQDFTINSELAQAERQYYIEKHKILDYSELPFCIVVPTFNNAQNNRYLNNIRSILMQEYNNYHIVVIDDASTDKTGKLISDFLGSQNKVPSNRYQIITNTEQKMAMYNLRRAAMEFCQPQEIFMIVDGDDELLGRQVLHLFNAVFQKNQAWFVYSNFLGSSGNIGYSRAFPAYTIEDNSYRKYPFVTSHLRAYYTQLFRNIKEEDLKDENGDYFRAANDVATCIPILEQSHKRVLYLPELAYLYNSNTGLNNHIVRLSEQKGNDRKIRKKPSYSELTTLMSFQ